MEQNKIVMANLEELQLQYLKLKDEVIKLDRSFQHLNEIDTIQGLKKKLAEKQEELDAHFKKTALSQNDSNFDGYIGKTREKIKEINTKIDKGSENLGKLESSINSVKQNLEKLSKERAPVDRELDFLKKQKENLERTIDHRNLIKILICRFSEDKERAKLAALEVEIQKKAGEINRIQTRISEQESILQSLENDHQKQKKELDHLCQEKKQCESHKADLEKARSLMSEKQNLDAEISEHQKSLETQQEKISEQRKELIKNIQNICNAIFKTQPNWKQCNPADFGNSPNFAAMMNFGMLQFFNKENKAPVVSIPRLIPFPVRATLLFQAGSEGNKWIDHFLFRIFQCTPLQYIEITAVDPISLGKSLSDFQLLLKNKRPFTQQKILTQADEIEDALRQLNEYAQNLIQKTFVGGITDWHDYNLKNPKNQLPYKLLIIYDLPALFTDKSLFYLTRVIEHGPQCGILPLLSLDHEKLKDKKYAALVGCLPSRCFNAEKMFPLSSFANQLKHLYVKETVDSLFDEQIRKSIIDSLASKFTSIGQFQGKFENVLTMDSLWQENSGDKLSTITGWEVGSNSPVPFIIGDDPAHILLGGKTGSGKSNFLHILICGLCSKYSPEELQLYLLDYKAGVEFNSYAKPFLLPHARLIATQSDIEYGLTVLRHLESELERRAELFKSVDDVKGEFKFYRSETKQKLPRILLIVDEFQKLFESQELAVSNEIEAILTDLLKRGRAFGIHLLLATQTIHGLQNKSRFGLLSNLTGRVALSCTQEDSAVILGSNNYAAAGLTSPPEAILNTRMGAKEANIVFSVPEAKLAVRQALLERLCRQAEQTGLILENTIFNGECLPDMPSTEEFRMRCSAAEPQLLLGTEHNFTEEPFTVNLAKDNLLIAGRDKTLRTGLLNAIFLSLKQVSPPLGALYLHSADDEIPLLPSARYDGTNFVLKDRSWNAEDLHDFLAREGKKIIIIDSYDYAGCFQNRNQSRFGRKPQDPKSPYEMLCEIADPTSQIQDVRILLFVEDYERFSSSTQAKDLFEHFNLRIGFGMDEDLAGRFVKPGSGYGKFTGIADSSKAVFVNRKTNERYLVRPFVLQRMK